MNKSHNENRPRLEVFGKFTPEGENLRPGYAYLIRSSVRMPELYPLLGELLFASRVVKDNEDGVPPNVIGMFIEDSPDNLIQHLKGPDYYVTTSDITYAFGAALVNNDEPRMAAWLDTFGNFHDAGGDLKEKIFVTDKVDKQFKEESGELKDKYKWWKKSVAGPGNPMAIMRFFRLVQEKPGGASLNVFLLNSLNNLYRNLGLSESAAFLKTMLNESIWSVEPDAKKQNILHKSGLFFAVLQEDVLDGHETSYLESFFDGIVKVDPRILDKKYRVACVNVEVLPEVLRSQAHSKFIYLPEWQVQNDSREIDDGWEKGVYIRTKLVSECKDLGSANDKNKKDQS